MFPKRGPIALRLLLVLILLATSGCGLIFGGAGSADIKSHDYDVVRLDRERGSDWQLLVIPENRNSDSKGKPQETGDVAFEHNSTGSIISVNSVCKGQSGTETLEDLSKNLLLGLNTRGKPVTRSIEVDQVPALESTAEALIAESPLPGTTAAEEFDDETVPVRVQAIVLRKAGCTFDLMLISRPASFATVLPTFERFVKGFHVHD